VLTNQLPLPRYHKITVTTTLPHKIALKSDRYFSSCTDLCYKHYENSSEDYSRFRYHQNAISSAVRRNTYSYQATSSADQQLLQFFALIDKTRGRGKSVHLLIRFRFINLFQTLGP